MKFRFISAHRETFKVGRMCTLLKVSRSGYYAWLKRPESRRSLENRALEDKIRVIHSASHGIYGSPKIYKDLIDDGVRCGKNRVARIMREAGIRSRTKKKFKATTNSRHNLPVAPNLLNQDFTVDVPDRTWVSDITYIHTKKGWLYLAVVLDLFNREIVGWATSSRTGTISSIRKTGRPRSRSCTRPTTFPSSPGASVRHHAKPPAHFQSMTRR